MREIKGTTILETSCFLNSIILMSRRIKSQINRDLLQKSTIYILSLAILLPERLCLIDKNKHRVSHIIQQKQLLVFVHTLIMSIQAIC